jgi:hypothetical protein
MVRLSYALLPLPLVACMGGERASTGQCPAGEVCSARTPRGLHFIGNTLVDEIQLTGPAPTAIGGTQEVALQYDRGDGLLVALDLAYEANDDTAAGITVDHTSGSVVTVRGAGSRTNYLRILDAADGTLFDRKELTGAAVDTIELLATDLEAVPAGAALAWAAGDQVLGVALYGQVQESGGPTRERLIDTSMQLALANGVRTGWDTLHVPNAVAGTHTVTVAAGDKPATNLDFVVVDHADSVSAMQPPATIAAGGSAQVCFAATASGRTVVGLTWTFLVDGTPHTQGADTLERNCIMVATQKTTGTVAIQASAGGQSASLALAVGAMARTRATEPRSARPTAGDRAAL